MQIFFFFLIFFLMTTRCKLYLERIRSQYNNTKNGNIMQNDITVLPSNKTIAQEMRWCQTQSLTHRDRQTNRQTDRKTDRQTNRQTVRRADWLGHTLTYIRTHARTRARALAHTHTHTHTHTPLYKLATAYKSYFAGTLAATSIVVIRHRILELLCRIDGGE